MVNAVNDAPTVSVSNPVVVTNEDTPLVIEGISIADVDAGTGTMQLTLSVTHGGLVVLQGPGLTSGGSVTLTGTLAKINQILTYVTGSTGVTYVPHPNYNGPDTLVVTVNDQGNTGSGGPLTYTKSIAINVQPVNDAPVAQNGTLTTAEDTGATGTLVATDIDSPTLTYILVNTASAHGVVTITNAGTGSYSYAPDVNYNGPASFEYKANDGSLDSNTATVTITVTAVNDAPVAVDDGVRTAEDTVLTLTQADLKGNDTDVDNTNDQLSVTAVSNPINGSVVLNVDGTVTFTPVSNFFGTAGFYYTLSDGALNNIPVGDHAGLVTVAVTSVNDAPVSNADAATVAEDGSVTFDPRTNDSTGPANESGQTLAVTAVSQGVHGTVSFTAAGVTYTPNADYNGPDSFTYTVTDNGTTNGVADPKSSTTTVSITVTAVNDAPVVVDDTATTAEDTAKTFSQDDLKGNDTDVDNTDAELSVTAVSNPSNGTVVLNVDGTVTFAPTLNFNGTAGFDYTLSDGSLTDTGHMSITVTAVNDAPTATNNAYSTSQATSVGGNVITDNTGSGADSDTDGNPLLVSSRTNPANGTLVLNANGSFVYTPNSTFSGTDTFTYTISDGDGGFHTAVVTIIVNPAAAGSILTVTDTCSDGGTALLITGSSANDTIVVEPGLTNSTLKVTINGVSNTVAKPSGRIIVTGGAGNDNIQIAGAVTNSVWLYGDAGDDRLNAGNANPGGNLLFGGDGNDDLLGGSGRDIMVGGQGADKITGNANDDILIAGLTTQDSRNSAAHDEFWCRVLEEWTDTSLFETRVNKLRTGTGSTGVNLVASVLNDNSVDQIDILQGSSGNDWFIYENGEDRVVGQPEASN